MKRREDELYYDYQARRMVDNDETKRKLRGKVIWTGNMGTALKGKIAEKKYLFNDNHRVQV
jgi:hypothetical protein